jgi:hypothetical protein
MPERHRISRRGLVALSIASLFLFISNAHLCKVIAATAQRERLINCDIQQGPCTKQLAEMVVSPPDSGKVEFVFDVIY